MTDFQLTMIERDGILAFWPLIHEGLKAIKGRSLENGNHYVPLNELATGRAVLWVGTKGPEVLGYVITRLQLLGNNVLELYIAHVYIRPNAPKEILDLALKMLQDYAIENRCIKITFKTIRDGFTKLLDDTWQPGYIEYYKKLESKECTETIH